MQDKEVLHFDTSRVAENALGEIFRVGQKVILKQIPEWSSFQDISFRVGKGTDVTGGIYKFNQLDVPTQEGVKHILSESVTKKTEFDILEMTQKPVVFAKLRAIIHYKPKDMTFEFLIGGININLLEKI